MLIGMYFLSVASDGPQVVVFCLNQTVNQTVLIKLYLGLDMHETLPQCAKFRYILKSNFLKDILRSNVRVHNLNTSQNSLTKMCFLKCLLL